MSRSLCRFLVHFSSSLAGCRHIKPFAHTNSLLCSKPVQTIAGVAHYSKRNGPPSDAGQPFKTVSNSRSLDDDLNGLEGEANWELMLRKQNRFYLPHATGPAWQGDNSTVGLLTPLSRLVNFFRDKNADKKRLEFKICQCPLLIRESLFELFPVRAVSQRDAAMTLLTLSYEGDIELGAAKFVLAARDITDRLLSLGYWADFLNPFSGRPYYVPTDGNILYKQDHRFRGINMKLSMHNDCMLIAAEEDVHRHFSGTVFTTAPTDYRMLLELLVPSEFRLRCRDLDTLH